MSINVRLLLILLTWSIWGQTFNGATGTITDNNSLVSFNCSVTGLPSSLNATFGLESICLSVNHTNVGDLEARLYAPDGSYIQLFKSIGGSGNNFTNTCLNMSAASIITSGSPPYTGTFLPIEEIGLLNNLQNPNGTWRLRIRDQVSGTQGSVVSWSLTFSANGAAPFSTNLPLFIINSGANTIADDPKVMADLKIVHNAGSRNSINGPYQFEGKIGIETRGSSSSGFPKRSYGFETWDLNGLQIDTNILDLPKESDYALIANYTDKSMMNNMLAYNLYREMGHFAPRNRYCEVIVNKVYRGVYLLTEKVKRDSARVSIAKLLPTDTTGTDVTGGYIIKIDKTTGSGGDGWTSAHTSPTGSSIYFQYEYPDPTVIHSKQATYIQTYFGNMENTLSGSGYNHPFSGYRLYFKLRSLLDYFLLNEISRNVDGLRISTFLYKEKSTDGGKLSFVPWDYDLGFGNADYCDGWRTDGWAYDFPNVCPGDGLQVPFWWSRFMEDSAFQADLKCRYEFLRTSVLSTQTLHNYIDSVATVINEGATRNFNTYPILGQYVWPNPSPIPADYNGELEELKTWIENRLDWLDSNIPGTCIMTDLNGGKTTFAAGLKASPNPTDSRTLLSWESIYSSPLSVTMHNSVGQLVLEKQVQTNPGENIFQLQLEHLTPGIYIVNLRSGDYTESYKIIRR